VASRSISDADGEAYDIILMFLGLMVTAARLLGERREKFE